jgi:hypothetical protein
MQMILKKSLLPASEAESRHDESNDNFKWAHFISTLSASKNLLFSAYFHGNS